MPRRTAVRGDPPAAPPPVPRNPLIADLVKQVTKQFGAGSIGVLSDSYETVHHVLPTGIASIDEATAIGGWPLGGKISEIYGVESVGKTTLSKLLAALSIKAGYLTAFIDMEGSLNLAPAFDAALGLDPSQLVVMGPPAIRTVEDCFQAIYRFVDLLKGKPGLILWDSVAATGTQVELETALDHAARPGVRALAMSRGFTQLMPRLKDAQAGVVFINQSRERIGALPFQDKSYSPGGTAFHHFCHFRVQMARIGNITGAGREIIGIRSRARVKKSKLGPPHREGRLAIYFRGAVEEDPEE